MMCLQRKWTRSNILYFLNIYENNPILWNPDHNDHQNQDLIREAWKTIGDHFVGYSLHELKTLESHLMGQFRYCQKPVWFAYEKMASFLKQKKDVSTTTDDHICEENDPIEITPDDINVVDENIVTEGRFRNIYIYLPS
uniref:Uncharacterized protein LOC114345510 n=1 Tax=Diabrotica virgifera virgifera TaxID=50390 RepID=A0A6P7H338_DIAVI